MKGSRASAKQAQAARETAEMVMDILEKLARIEQKLDKLLAEPEKPERAKGGK